MEVELNLGDIVEAEITKVTNFGAFAKINGGSLGLIHISQISNRFVKDINEHLKVGDKLKAKVIKLGPGKKIDLSLKIKQEAVSGEGQRGRAFNSPGQKNNSSLPAPRNAMRAGPPAQRDTGRTGFKSSDFEVKLKKFLRESDRSLADLKKRQEKYHR